MHFRFRSLVIAMTPAASLALRFSLCTFTWIRRRYLQVWFPLQFVTIWLYICLNIGNQAYDHNDKRWWPYQVDLTLWGTQVETFVVFGYWCCDISKIFVSFLSLSSLSVQGKLTHSSEQSQLKASSLQQIWNVFFIELFPFKSCFLPKCPFRSK